MRSFLHTLLLLSSLLSLAAFAALDRIDPTPVNTPAEKEYIRRVVAALQARHDAVDELLAGRQTFSETAARFRQVAAEDPNDVMRHLRTFNSGRSDAELYYLHVILYVEAARSRDPR